MALVVDGFRIETLSEKIGRLWRIDKSWKGVASRAICPIIQSYAIIILNPMPLRVNNRLP